LTIANSPSTLSRLCGHPMGFAAINVVTVEEPFTLRQMNSTVRAGDHFFRGGLSPICFSAILWLVGLSPKPPDDP